LKPLSYSHTNDLKKKVLYQIREPAATTRYIESFENKYYDAIKEKNEHAKNKIEMVLKERER
jgi:abortive infection bacteriophage resistance protein